MGGNQVNSLTVKARSIANSDAHKITIAVRKTKPSYESEVNTTKRKKIDFKKAINDLGHDPKISPEEGIEKTINWMKKFYNV